MSVCIQYPARSKLWAPYRMDACSLSYILKVNLYLALPTLPNPVPIANHPLDVWKYLYR